MVFTKYVAPASGVLTATIWNNQINDIGSGLNVIYDVRTGSDYFVYDASGNCLSGIHHANTGSWYERYVYDANNNVISGLTLKDGQLTTAIYYYGTGSTISGITFTFS